jgi:hypothetical protein
MKLAMRSARLASIMVLLILACGSTSLAQNDSSSLIVEVVNSTGQPIKNACVTFVPRSGDIVFRKADRRGRVKIKRLLRGNYRVVVKVDGYEAQKKEVVVAGAEDKVGFVMHPREYR